MTPEITEYTLTPAAKYSGALRRCKHIRDDHPERKERLAAMREAAEEFRTFEEENLSLANLQRGERLARRRASREARR